MRPSDIGGRDDLLNLERLSDTEWERRQDAARRVVAGQPDEPDLLEMLGLEPYESFERPVRRRLIHGTRGGYTNFGCGQEGTDPCPESPTCREQHTAYMRDYRERVA